MNNDAGATLTMLKVDGGMISNETLMQFQADILGVPVVRPVIAETTALGAAYAAGLAVGYWSSTNDIRRGWAEGKRWYPQMEEAERSRGYHQWRKAVQRTLNWVDGDS
jgi:glycerol kinase